MPVTNVMWQVLEAVRTGLATVPNAPTPQVRYKLELFGSDTPPLLIIAPGKRSIRARQFVNDLANIWYNYEVHVALVTAGNRKSAAGLQAYLQLEADLNYQLTQTELSGAPAVFDTNLDDHEIVKFASRLETQYDVTGWSIRYCDAELTKG